MVGCARGSWASQSGVEEGVGCNLGAGGGKGGGEKGRRSRYGSLKEMAGRIDDKLEDED